MYVAYLKQILTNISSVTIPNTVLVPLVVRLLLEPVAPLRDFCPFGLRFPECQMNI